jgi:broad specificity polyphosphatase/5'/3'-nucleotidase SurE
VRKAEGRRGSSCYWIEGTLNESEEAEDSDVKAVRDKFVSLTFLTHDTTNFERNAAAESRIPPWEI